ncbi:PIG-L deacetylase family protein [Desertimonas flava]|uniref:PIG-L deacetylase family protein n=1 Tax=Desertimonas flava TaxID=2064846 RepID=UPI000E34E826|nr:PIG-L deacetylase family protein [Desertimonas flava]
MLPVSLGTGRSGPLQVLLLGAHSDDIEIGCGGTVLRLLAERPGSTIHWVVFSAAGQRAEEARTSAAAFTGGAAGVTLHSFRESYFPYVGAEIKDAFEELCAGVEPDVVFTHRRDDEHQDHRTIAALTWNTFRNHLVAEYEIPKYEGDLGHPNLFVPLTAELAERKIELLTEHFASQRNRAWFRPATFRGLMALRGVECVADYAEAFHIRKLII